MATSPFCLGTWRKENLRVCTALMPQVMSQVTSGHIVPRDQNIWTCWSSHTAATLMIYEWPGSPWTPRQREMNDKRQTVKLKFAHYRGPWKVTSFEFMYTSIFFFFFYKKKKKKSRLRCKQQNKQRNYFYLFDFSNPVHGQNAWANH